MRLETHAIDGRHGAAVRRHQNRLQIIVLARPIKHLEWARNVEQIDAFVNGNSQLHSETSLTLLLRAR